MVNTHLIDNAQTQSANTQRLITPDIAVELLKDGNERFLTHKQLSRKYDNQVRQTADGQYPFAIVLSCIDSRVSTEIIFDQGIGDIFNACVAGNFVNEDILGSMEYACKFAGVKLVLVLGHTSCGAVKGACDAVELGNLTQLLSKLTPAITATQTAPDEVRSSSNLEFVNNVAAKNVELTIQNIRSQSPVLHEMCSLGEIAIVSAMYDVQSGKVNFFK